MSVQLIAHIGDRLLYSILCRASDCLSAGHCEDGGERLPLELHHLRYVTDDNPKNAVPIFGLEKPEDLLALCRHCHLRKHINPFGDFVLDPEECQGDWQYVDQVHEKA